MNLYLISQSVNSNYDTYDSAIVAAPDEDTARRMHPRRGLEAPSRWEFRPGSDWTAHENVTVEYIGDTLGNETEPRVILASFNAG